MNKLLHERLRDIALRGGYLNCVRTLIGKEECPNGDCRDCVKQAAKTLADEIEKYYIPRPRFEDGEPVQIGDAFIQKCINEEVGLDKIGIVLFTKDGLNMVWFPDEVVQRPEPKVLDADGVEIKVGDTVWVKGDVNKGKVEEVHKDRVWVKWNDGWTADVYIGDVSHREPDSLEKLLVELRGVDFIPSEEYLNHIADRLTAIMERDA